MEKANVITMKSQIENENFRIHITEIKISQSLIKL